MQTKGIYSVRGSNPCYGEIRIATLVHSFRNPLNTIRGAVTFIKEEYRSDRGLIDFTGIIEEEIARLEMLVSQLLASSFTIIRRYTDINDLLKTLEAATSLQAACKGIETSYEYSTLPMIKIDAFQIEQAIRNIINNAIEVMPRGGHLTVKTGIESNNVFIEIKDTGVGIYRRFPSKGSPGNNGRGFGLFIARQILSIHGGKLIIKSGDKGTTVKMVIPLNGGHGGRKENGTDR